MEAPLTRQGHDAVKGFRVKRMTGRPLLWPYRRAGKRAGKAACGES